MFVSILSIAPSIWQRTLQQSRYSKRYWTWVAATAAAIAVGAGVLFRAITLQQAGRRRRKRSIDTADTQTGSLVDTQPGSRVGSAEGWTWEGWNTLANFVTAGRRGVLLGPDIRQ